MPIILIYRVARVITDQWGKQNGLLTFLIDGVLFITMLPIELLECLKTILKGKKMQDERRWKVVLRMAAVKIQYLGKDKGVML